jgi:hypothetical protein
MLLFTMDGEKASASMAYFQGAYALQWAFADHEVCALTAPGPLNSTAGSLYVVATPIGNLDDISARALKVLREVALIAAEDTRHSQRLMQHFGIARRWRRAMSTTSAMKVVVSLPVCWPATMWR